MPVVPRPQSVCVSPNEVICHGIPDCRPIENGDIINLDVTVYLDGFHADLNETYFVGQCDESSKLLVRTAYGCLAAAQAMIRPGPCASLCPRFAPNQRPSV